jgi:hypothetical protein
MVVGYASGHGRRAGRRRGMADIATVLVRWGLGTRQVRDRIIVPRRRASASAGTRSGCWRRAGPPTRSPSCRSATPIRSGAGWRPSSRRATPPRPRRGCPGGAEGRRPVRPGGGGHRPGELALAGGAPGQRGALRRPARPQRLYAFPAPARLRRQAPEEAAAPGRRACASSPPCASSAWRCRTSSAPPPPSTRASTGNSSPTWRRHPCRSASIAAPPASSSRR